MSDFWDQNSSAWIQAVRTRGIPSREITSPSLLNAIQTLAPERLLDVGCGEGWLAPALQGRIPKLRYLGIDGSPALIQAAQETYPDFSFRTVAYSDLGQRTTPLDSERFDLAVFNFSLFTREVGDIFQSIRREIHPKTGRILIQTLPPALQRSEPRREDFKSMTVPFSGQMEWFHLTREDWLKNLDIGGFTLESEQIPRHPNDASALSWIFIARLI